MRYRTLGKTGLRVSVIGIGTWQLGGEWARNYSQAEADAIFDAAAESGINLIDTAECYGDHTAEKLIGDYLSRHDRSRWVIATKFGHRFNSFMNRTDDFTSKGIREQLDASLKALRTDVIDIYQFHSGSDELFLNEAMWKTLYELKHEGKIRHLGISILQKGSEPQAREAAHHGVEVLQVVYNRLDRRAEQLYFPHAQRDNLGILARVPLASGLLSGKYRPGTSFPKDDIRATFDADLTASRIRDVETIQQSEVPQGVPMGQWALAWCLKNPLVSAVIPGCRDAAQVKANAAAASLLD
jgi:aryl-alcohol dehydrogenase-like predicted oxidoreductase